MTSRTDADETPATSLWRHRDFRRYLTGQTASVAGSSVSSMAIPVLAVLELNATAAQVAWLMFLGQLPPALLALHAGALGDRHSKKRQMITSDLVSAAALATVPAAAALHALTLSQLMVVAAVQGAAGVLQDAASISLLPTLVERSLIQRSNSHVMSATVFGLVLGLGALGAAAGALWAPTAARRFGPGPMMLTALSITPLTQIPLLLASPGPGWQITIGSALFLQLACAGAAGTTQRSIRQIITASAMQARMQAVSTWLTSAARPVAALLAGGCGTWLGVRPTLIGGALLLIVPVAVLARSPLRGLRIMPLPPPDPARPADPPVPPPIPADV
ncbi:MFS transporter [Streptomyces sp. NPDC056982]|uniref:MFS transporter n=1 Tax=Streptomyces sp. NPDC056982 TaxID=3345986 RepID=UPI00363F07E0